MLKRIKKCVAVFSMVGALVLGSMSNIVIAAESQEWYVYYNNASNNSTTDYLSLSNYLGYYTAAPTYRNVSTVYTLIQPNTSLGTNTEKKSYAVGASNVNFYVSTSNGATVYLYAKISYNTAPATMSGIVSHP